MKSPQHIINSNAKRFNFNSTMGFNQFQIGNMGAGGGQSLRNQIQNHASGINIKNFAQQTITSKFGSGRNSDTFLNKVQNTQIKKGAQNLQSNKNTHKLKNNNLMIDANSTFMAVERSRSGIGALASPAIVSPFGAAGGVNFGSIQNQHQLNLFNTTVTKNMRGRTNSNLKNMSPQAMLTDTQASHLQKLQQEFNMTNAFNLSTISPNQGRAGPGQRSGVGSGFDTIITGSEQPSHKKHAYLSPGAGSTLTQKMGISGSQLKIPTITLNNQSFYNSRISPQGRGQKERSFGAAGSGGATNRSPGVGQQLSNGGSSGYLKPSNSNSGHNFMKTIYNMPSINSIQGSSIKKGKELKQKINQQIQKSQIKLQIVQNKKNGSEGINKIL